MFSCVQYKCCWPDKDFNQRKGMGLLEYQIMPSLCDIADDGVLCTFSTRSAPDWDKWCGPSRQAAIDRPSRTNSHPAGPYSQPGGPPCWASPLAFGRIGFYTLAHLFTTAGTQGSHLAAIELYPGRSQASVHNRGITRKKAWAYYRVPGRPCLPCMM